MFIAGDSAHALPPSGGFGLNTGIGDAFNLAHKIAWAKHNKDDSEVASYNEERRLIGRLTRDFAVANYDKGVEIAKMLNLNKNNLDYANTLISTLLPSSIQQQALESCINIGLQAASTFANAGKV